jgi:AraC-like DNA-binding protein
MQRQSFAEWRLPRELDGLLLVEDHGEPGGRVGTQERHFHDELELHLVDRGHGLFLFPGARLPVAAGTVVWIPPGRDHLLLEASADFRRWMLLFRPRVVRRVLPKAVHAALLGRTREEQSKRLPERALASLQHTYSQVRADRGAEIRLFNAGMAFALARSWHLFESASRLPEPAAFHPAVSRALRLLREVAPPSTLTELASQAKISESHLSKLFSSQVGVSLTECRNRIRIERFVEVYGDGSRATLMVAALEAGFGSYPQFYRVFLKQMGYPPGEHRGKALGAR